MKVQVMMRDKKTAKPIKWRVEVTADHASYDRYLNLIGWINYHAALGSNLRASLWLSRNRVDSRQLTFKTFFMGLPASRHAELIKEFPEFAE